MCVLTSEQQDKLRQFKIKTRIDNERYLRSHPEVEIMISDFLRDVLLKRPTDIRRFAADHFGRTVPDVPDVVTDSNLEANGEAE
ncbi:unnamed protein product [Tetraodon nigroviridis]|uniref:(spotted green pufferfish) hypothetical protein n=1 Tax=Tetraodon nigroviridis TaxID=99883 RepID=Q4RI97_TETNG|nr:unnamed protein product [Tetraodon nigroviridis]